ncbi:MAG: 16S rRNA (uracil(1498)-N(3))-methyltransferase [Rhodobacterales bacterium]|nr:MAG: 16S rRNA (uracil(1498)-N(3))-methyltransferase [Rhodobacterales bacterium]
MEKAKIRLCVTQDLQPEQTIVLEPAQAHYLFVVMRLQEGAPLLLFNGRDGEYLARVSRAHKRHGTLECLHQTKALQLPPDLWLLFAPIKKTRTAFIVEKAAELGAARICPVQTRYTNAERIRQDRLQAHALEAAEQCGGTYVPEVDALRRLEDVLQDWPADRHLVFCDEELVGRPSALPARSDQQKWAILIGPEGGFSPQERVLLSDLPFVSTLSLGPRILRADTAAVAALTLWQAALGDW